MAYIQIKDDFHVALNGNGLILQGAPDRIAYSQQQAPTYGQRFASGDRTYNDLSKWWYFDQTDWSNGLKDDLLWEDDGTFYLSSNVDTWSEPGSVKLARKQVLQTTLTEDCICGVEGEVNGTTSKFLGTVDAASGKPIVYRYNGVAWVDISSVQMTTNQNVIAQLMTRNGYLWVVSVGAGTTNVVIYWDGTNWVDASDEIGGGGGGALSWQPLSSRCMVTIGSKIYVFVDNATANEWALVSATLDNPTVDADWTKVIEKTNDDGLPVACCEYSGNIYYLVNRSTYCDLRVYDIANATDTHLWRFRNTALSNWGVGDKYLVVHNGKLIITIPDSEIWIYDGSALDRIYKRDTFKASISNSSFGQSNYGYLTWGAVISDNKVWWGNLMFDGESFYYWIRDPADGSEIHYPLFIDASDAIWSTYTANEEKVYKIINSGSTYKGTADRNYILFSNIGTLSGIDKLAYSFTILFKALASGEKIVVEYFNGELTSNPSFTTLGNVNFTSDGSSVTDKKFFFPVGTTFKKLWIKISFEGGGSTTPTLTDAIMEYLPIPTQSKLWNLSVNCGDEVKRLNGRLVEKTGRELKSLMEIAWWTKSTLDFQDMDYATTLINSGGGITASATTITVDSTVDFPEQGRIMIDNEQMFYTGKTPTTFTGVTRGVRDTRATTHSDDAVVNNAYKVIITNLSERIPIMLEGKQLEYIVGIELREV